ncbi:hypothetical protein BGZ82_005707 [Podila clonocystis]|nr:hypothetical protein BGZ82_005707 [Podila clonocystis]
MATASPLDITKILSLIASFVPVWEGPSDDLKFIPRNLLSCALVCKNWREAMLPHLWAVYSNRHMCRIPNEVTNHNGIHFQHYDRITHSKKDRINSFQRPEGSKNYDFQCTALKSFTLTSAYYQAQYELLRTNTGIMSLQWIDFKPNDVPVLLDVLQPLATTLKELTVHYPSFWQALEPFVLLDIFPRLERLKFVTQHSRNMTLYSAGELVPDLAAFLNSSIRKSKAQYPSVKQLTVPVSMSSSFLLQILSRCPRVEHLVVEMDPDCGEVSIGVMHGIILRWRAAYKVWLSHLDTPPRHPSLKDAAGGKVLERLDIHMEGAYDEPGSWLRARFERGCEDFVGLSACVGNRWARVLAPFMQRFKDTLREVDLQCKADLTSGAAFVRLARILGSTTALRRWRLVSEAGLSKVHSMHVFQLHGVAEGSVASWTRQITANWACRELESLVIKGLEGIYEDLSAERTESVTLPAASKEHRWATRGTTFDPQLKQLVSYQVQRLPALRTLILNNIVFDYEEIPSPVETGSES